MIVRRREWGDERALALRARRLFGAPPVYRSIVALALRRETVRNERVSGEWLAPRLTKAGVILYIHGGGYVACSPETHRPITAALARLGKRPVLSIHYRLAPEHRFPAATDDVFAAYQWLLDAGYSAQQIAVAGDSAGGGLALSLLVRARGARMPLPACAVLFSPWTDLAGTGSSVFDNDGRCAMFRSQNVTQFARAYLGASSPTDPNASPVYADLRGLPPLLLQVGSTELLLDDARRVHRRVLEGGGQSRLEIFDDVLHCWQMLDGLVPEARTALRQAAAFVDQHLSEA